MEEPLVDATQQVSTKTIEVDVFPQHLFSHESRLKKEAKGGYLEGKIKLVGLTDNDVVDKIELYLVSDVHSSKHHCNYLHITGTGEKRHTNDVKLERRNEDWKIVLKNDAGILMLDSETHQYMKNTLSYTFYDESKKNIELGRGKLQLTIVRPLSKTNHDFKKIIRLRSKSSDIVDEISNLCRPGEPFMHLARLHVVVHLKNSSIPIEGTSDLITDRDRYEVRYDNDSKNIILNNSVLQKYTLVFEKCMPPDKVSFGGNFVYVDKNDEEERRIAIDESEIKIVYIHRTGHERKCVEVYFTTTSGKVLDGAILGKYNLYFLLKVVEKGLLGDATNYSHLVSEKNIIECEIGAYFNHDCALDRHLRNSETCNIDDMLTRANEYVHSRGEKSSSNINQCRECYEAKDNLQKLCIISKQLTMGSNKRQIAAEEYSALDDSHPSPKCTKIANFRDTGKIGITSYSKCMSNYSRMTCTQIQNCEPYLTILHFRNACLFWRDPYCSRTISG